MGDSYDNALAETVNGLYKSELIYSQTWETLSEIEFATMNWVYWWNNTRLHESLDYSTPEEVITRYNQTHAKQLAPTKEAEQNLGRFTSRVYFLWCGVFGLGLGANAHLGINPGFVVFVFWFMWQETKPLFWVWSPV